MFRFPFTILAVFLGFFHTQAQICPSSPQAGFSTAINNLSVTFADQSAAAASWYWEFGNGPTANPTHLYGTPGTYTVCQIVSNACGADTLCQTITVDCPEPVAGFSTSAQDLTVSFFGASTLTQFVAWNFGDGNGVYTSDPVHTYPAPGSYTACLVAFNDCGMDTFCTTVSVNCALPTAGFTTATQFFATLFSDASQDADSVFWDFGDGITATGRFPSHIYMPGNYTACQIAINACGADTLCQQVLAPCPLPVVDFSATSNGLSATFTHLSQGGDTLIWSFGDGSTSSQPNPVHSYAAGGIYYACLTVSNGCGSVSFCDTVSIVPDCDLEVALTSQNPSCGLPNGAVSADVSGSAFPYTFAWSNGETTRTIASMPAGTYRLTVWDAAGCEARDSVVLHNTSLPPQIDLGEARAYCGGAWLDAGAAGTHFLWQDGSTSPVYQVQQSGIYRVEVRNAAGCTSRDSVAIQIDTAPLAGFAYQASGLVATFFNGANYGASYHWDLGDGNSSDQFQPVHTYSAAGSYLVTLIVENTCGSDTIANTVHVAVTSLQTPAGSLQVSVFPNPSHGQFVAELNGALGEWVHWEIASLSGRQLRAWQQMVTSDAHREPVELSDMAAGIYLLRVQVGNRRYIRKISILP